MLNHEKKNIGIIIPCYNESLSIQKNIKTLSEILNNLTNKYLNISILLINDGSEDNTWSCIEELISDKSYIYKIYGINLNKNYGKDKAIFASLESFEFDSYIVVDADGEHPFELIPEMIDDWIINKYKIIEGKRKNHNGLFGYIKSLFYFLSLKYIAGHNIFLNITDFKLIDNEIKKKIFSIYQNPKYWKIITFSLGDNYLIKEFYSSKNQIKIKSSFSLFSLISLFLNHIFGQSTKIFKSILLINLFFILVFSISYFFFSINISIFIFSLIVFMNINILLILKKFEYEKNLYKSNVLIVNKIEN